MKLIKTYLAAGAIAAVAGLGYGLWWLLRRRIRDKTWDRSVQRAAAALQRQLVRVNQGRAQWETWAAVAKRLQDVDREVSEAIAAFAVAYDRARYAAATGAHERAVARARAHEAAALARKLRKP